MNTPAWLTNRTDPFGGNDDFLGGIGSALPPHLSINMNRFTLIDGAGNEKPPAMHIDVCIIAANDKSSRIYYDPSKRYDPTGSDNAPPICWSDNGTGPSRNAATPQAPTCAACPNAVWGSATSQMTGRGVPACQTGKKIAFLVPGDSDDILYMFRIPPASLKNLAQYIKTLAGHNIGNRPAKASDVLTRFEFESQGVIKFTPVGLIDEDTFNRTETYYGQVELIKQITGRDDVARDPNLPIGAPAKQDPISTGIRQQALSTITPPAEPKKRGRPAKVQDPEDMPPFLDRRPAAPKKAEAPAQVGPGMVQASAPSSEIANALDNVFNLPGIT